MKFFKTFFLFSIVSCNIGDRVKEDISNKIDNTKTELAITEDSIKTTFLNKYGETKKKKLNDSSEIKIKNTVIVLMETVGYIDSLKTVVGKLENMEDENSTLVKEIFLKNGCADTLYNKLYLSYSMVKSIALTQPSKKEINEIALNS